MDKFTKRTLLPVITMGLLVAGVIALTSPSNAGLVNGTALQIQSEGIVRGLVSDAAGYQQSQPIPDATVSLYSPQRVLQNKSDNKGRFTFTRVPFGTYQVEVERPGFKTKKVGSIQVSSTRVDALSITLDVAAAGNCVSEDSISYSQREPGKTLTCSAFDSNKPLQNAEIRLLSSLAPERVLASERSNGNGQVIFTNQDPGQYVLRVSHPGFHDQLSETFWITNENSTRVVIRTVKEGLMRVCQ